LSYTVTKAHGQDAPEPETAEAGALKYNPALRSMSSIVVKMLREQTLSDPAAFDKYVNEYVLPQFVDSKNQLALPKVRKNLRVMFLAGKSGAPYERLNKLVLRQMGLFIKGSYSPTIKYNAMLVIADLNEVEADPRTPAKPLPSTLPILLKTISSQQPDMIRIAALVGLERHAESNAFFPLAPEAKTGIIKMALAQLNQQQPASRSLDGHIWIRRSAARILGALGEPGPDNSVAIALDGLINDSETPEMLRCTAASAIGQLHFPPAAKINFADLGHHLGWMEIDLGRNELESAKNKGLSPSRRKLKFVVHCGLSGLIGPDGKQGLLLDAASGPHAKPVNELTAKLQSVSKMLDNADLSEEKLAIDMGARLGELERMLPPRTKPGDTPKARATGDKVAEKDGKKAAVAPQ